MLIEAIFVTLAVFMLMGLVSIAISVRQKHRDKPLALSQERKFWYIQASKDK